MPSYETLIAPLEWKSIWGPARGPEGRAWCLIKGAAQRGDRFLSVLQRSSGVGNLQGDKRTLELLTTARSPGYPGTDRRFNPPTWRPSG